MNFYAKIPLSTTANANILANQKYQLILFLTFGLLEYISILKKVNDLLSFGLSILTINFDEQYRPNRLLNKEQLYDISPENAQFKWNKLNIEQLATVQKIINTIEGQNMFSKDGVIFYLNSLGSTKKTMQKNIVISKSYSK